MLAVVIIVQSEDLKRLAGTAAMPYAYLAPTADADERFVLERLLRDRSSCKMQFCSAVSGDNLALVAASGQ